MTKITSTIELNDEQLDALEATVAKVNARAAEDAVPWTNETFLADQQLALVNGYVEQFGAETLTQFHESLRGKTYAQRKAALKPKA